MLLCFKEKDGTVNLRVTGKLARDPEFKPGNDGKQGRVKFSLCYGKSKFMNCEFWAGSTAGRLAGCLEKNDHAAVDGVYRSWTYQDKTYGVLQGEFLSVQMDAPGDDAESVEAEMEAQAQT